jgi:hypothetical protein
MPGFFAHWIAPLNFYHPIVVFPQLDVQVSQITTCDLNSTNFKVKVQGQIHNCQISLVCVQFLFLG